MKSKKPSTAVSGKEKSRSKSGEKKLKSSNTSSSNKIVKTPVITNKKSVGSNNIVNLEDRVKSPKNKVKKTKKSSPKEALNYGNYDQSQINRYTQDGMDEEQHFNNLKINSQVMDKNYQNFDYFNNLKTSYLYSNNNNNNNNNRNYQPNNNTQPQYTDNQNVTLD